MKNSHNTENGLADNSVLDLRIGDDYLIFAGTSGGISLIDLSTFYSSGLGQVEYFNYITEENLPEGGNSALVTYRLNSNIDGYDYDVYQGNMMVVVSGMIEEIEDEPHGTGLSWSLDNGETWNDMNQPVDQQPECNYVVDVQTWYPGHDEFNDNIADGVPDECWPVVSGCTWNNNSESCSFEGAYVPFYWPDQNGEKLYNRLAYDTKYNVTYDISVDINNGYVYAASWAGVLRRFQFYDFSTNQQIVNPTWELVPLPEDGQPAVACNEFGGTDYVYNPWDPHGEDNHKVYSVHVDDNYVWAGTAHGINRGEFKSDGCIEWTHNSSDLAGNWIIDIEPQLLNNGETRLWLISWNVIVPVTPHDLTYIDLGQENATWEEDVFFMSENAIVYNLYFVDCDQNINTVGQDCIYASTTEGLYYKDSSNSNNVWEKVTFLDEPSISEIIDTDLVFTSISYEDVYDFFFIGTPDGLVVYNCTFPQNCSTAPALEFEYNTDNTENVLNIFPNPLRIGSKDNDEVHFLFKSNTPGIINIYDFNMDKVDEFQCDQSQYSQIAGHMLEGHISCEWDGLNLKNDYVANGVYFCRLSVNNNYYWEKLLVINY